jgi:hypothetical protein
VPQIWDGISTVALDLNGKFVDRKTLMYYSYLGSTHHAVAITIPQTTKQPKVIDKKLER